MDDEEPLSRRRYLEFIGVSSLGGLAGCSEQSGPPQPTATTSSTMSRTERRTPTPSETPTDTVGDTETPDQWDVDPLEQDKLVGAHYYPWYWGEDGYGLNTERPWLEHSPYTPLLGQYDSRNQTVVSQHITWALEHGINWFILNTGSPKHGKGKAIREGFLQTELSDQIQWSAGSGFDGLPVTDERGRYILDDPENIEEMRRQFEGFEEYYFGHPNYLHIEGRPVVYDFPVNAYTGDLNRAFEAATDDLAEKPYLIANPTTIWFMAYDTPIEVFAAYDAMKTYVDLPYWDMADATQTYVDSWTTMAMKWRLTAEHYDVSYIPGVTPGFNDTEIKWEGRTQHDVLKLSSEQFGDLCRESLKYVDQALNAVIVTSWNEFPEGTAIEPTEEYGHTRLEVVKANLGTQTTAPIPVDEYPLMTVEFDRTIVPDVGDDTRSLAFFLTELRFRDDGGVLQKYDIGNYPAEPAFMQGVFHLSSIHGSSGRWLGGDEATSALYVHPDVADAREAVLQGRTPQNEDITADIYFDDVHGGQVDLGEAGEHEYVVPLSLQ